MANYCMECGTKLPENAAFCPECGAKLFTSAADAQDTGYTGTRAHSGRQQPAQAEPYTGQRTYTEPQQDRGQPEYGQRNYGQQSYGQPNTRQPDYGRQDFAQPENGQQSAGRTTAGRTAADSRFHADGDYTSTWRAAPSAAQVPPVTRSAPQAVPKKKGRRGLSLFLALIMLAELGVAAFKYPGFLVEDERPPYASYTTKATGSGKVTTAATTVKPGPGGMDGNGLEAVSYNGPALTRDLQISFSDREIAAAPAVSAPVSKDNPAVVCGDLQVNFESWNLPEGEDTFTVRTLGTKADEAAGWQLECWDLSLASGTHEFITNIEVTVPRSEDDDVLTTFVCYNEATGQWEDLYSEIGGDGQSYRVYMKHFSPLGKKMLFGWDPTKHIERSNTNDLLEKYNTDMEMFVELNLISSTRAYSNKRTILNDRMQQSVRIDYNRFWKKAEEGSIADIEEAVKQFGSDAASIKKAFENLAKLDSKSIGDYATTTTGVHMSWADFMQVGAETGSALSRALGAVGVGLGVMDLSAAYTRISNDAKLRNGIVGHDLDFVAGLTGGLSAIAGAASLAGISVPTPVTWGLAAVSLSLFVYGQAESGLAPLFQYSKDGITQKLYDAYNHEQWGFQDAEGYGMPDLEFFLNDELRKEFQAWVDRHPLGYGTIELYATTEEGNREERIDGTWVEMITKLLEMSKAHPDKLPADQVINVINEIIEKRANLFFDLDSARQQEAYTVYRDSLKGTSILVSGQPIMLSDYDMLGSEYMGYTDEGKEAMIDYEIARLKIVAGEVAEKVMESMVADARLEAETYLEETLLPALNTMMCFRVKDSAVENFSDSVYCHDFYDYPGNRDWLIEPDYLGGETADWAETELVDYADSELMAPMAFYGVQDPLFVPLRADSSVSIALDELRRPYVVYNDVWVSRNEYYPNADNFLPRAHAYSPTAVPLIHEDEDNADVVFMCTMYHYMMMGAPTAMTFRSYPEEALREPEKGEEAKRYKPDSELTVTFGRSSEFIKEAKGWIDITIVVEGDIGIDAFLGEWVLQGTEHSMTISYSGDSLRVYEYAEDDFAGGAMDKWKLDPKTRTLTVGDERIEGESMSFQLQDNDHLVLRSSNGSFTLTRVKDGE